MSNNPNVRLFYPDAEVAVHFFHRTSGNQARVDYVHAAKVVRRILAGKKGKWVLADSFISTSTGDGPPGNLVDNYVMAVESLNP